MGLKRRGIRLLSGVAIAVFFLAIRGGRAQSPAPHGSTAQTAENAINEYCSDCHNAQVKTAGVVLDPAALARLDDQPGDHAELWERVVRQLRAKSMPPVGNPRPDDATYQQFRTYLETALDRAAAARPNPGELPNLHRLTRTEYRNAIRDLLALDNLPKEMDFTLLLPADNSASGFDNIADLLYVSPATMERYLDAATKISRLAVGDPQIPVMVNIHQLPLEEPQDSRVEDLPFGTRGGIAIHSYFPLDADYDVQVELAGTARTAHQLEISVDGERKQLVPIGGGGGRGGRRGGAPNQFRIPVTAGPHLIGVTFVQITEALDEATLRPRQRTRGTQPAVAAVTIRGPYNGKGPGDTPSRERIFTCRPSNDAAEAPCAKQILSTLMRRAYRRPVTDQDLAALLPFYEKGRKERDFDLGVQTAIERLLVSPQFLYRIERDPAGAPLGTNGPAHPVSDLELASRLSFFIWSSIPDDELLNVAAAGKLKDPAVLEKETRRMLADARSESLVTNFAAQWLYLRDVEVKKPDLFLFRDFDEGLRESFEKETDLFLNSILRDERRSVLDLLTANYTFVNERLAKHYGIPNVTGSEFRRVELPKDSPRAGLLGQGSILTLTSYSTRTSPVLRGKYVLENLLASAPPPPPANVPSLNTEGEKGGEPPSLREAMVQHRASPACANCHARMDPIGFAMENFDAVGQWRDTDLGKPIDVSSTLADGSVVNGVAGVRQLILRDPERFVGAVAEKLLMYGIGRNVQYYDQPAVRKIVHSAAANNNTFASLVLGVVESAPFQMRAGKIEQKAEARKP
jgi:mono/diheme cytochrome c family protein